MDIDKILLRDWTRPNKTLLRLWWKTICARFWSFNYRL